VSRRRKKKEKRKANNNFHNITMQLCWRRAGSWGLWIHTSKMRDIGEGNPERETDSISRSETLLHSGTSPLSTLGFSNSKKTFAM